MPGLKFPVKLISFSFAGMDELMEVSFSPLAATGKPLSRCGKCHRFMKYIQVSLPHSWNSNFTCWGALSINFFSIIELGFKCGHHIQECLSKTKRLIGFCLGGQTREQLQLGLPQVLNSLDRGVAQEICVLFPGQAESPALLSL